MHPILFEWGQFHLYSYGFSIALGVLSVFYLMQKAALKDGFPTTDQVYDAVFISVLTGFVGARLFYAVQHASEFSGNILSIFAIWQGGLIFYGGLAAGFLSLWCYSRWHGLSFLRLMDFILPYGALVHAFGRVGCFLNGCCYGKSSHLPWAVLFPGLSHAVHPSQLYEAVYNLMVFLILKEIYRRKPGKGNVTAFYLILYGLGRFIIENYRVGNPGWLITWNQWISLSIISAGVILYKILEIERNSNGVKEKRL